MIVIQLKSIMLQCPLVNGDEAKGACPTCWLAGIVRMIDAVHDRHFGEVEWTYPVQASNIDGKQLRIGSSLMVRVNSTAGAEEVLR